MVIMMYGMMNGSMYDMMNGPMIRGMSWGVMVVCAVFALLFSAVLVLIIMSLFRYLRKPD